MPEGESRDAESAWQGQQEEPLQMTLEEVCIKARALEKKSQREYWLALGVLALFMVKAGIYFVVLLEVRMALFLLFPGMVAGWWGGAAIEIARRLGIDAPWYARMQESPAPPVAFALVLAAAWIGFGKAARQIGREIENLGR